MAYQQKLTELGQDIIAETQTGKLLTFTKLELGQGVSTVAAIPAMTALVDPIMQSGIASVSFRSLGQVTIVSKVSVPAIPQSFWLNEIGLYAQVDNGPEQLYAVSVADAFPDSLSPSMLGGSTAEYTIALAVIIGTTENVTAVFDPDIACDNIGPVVIGPGFYSRREANTFMFKRLVASSDRILLTEDNDTVRIDSPVVPTGGMMPFAGLLAPTGWLMCDGASHSRATFPELANVLGTRYGGDATNFNVPDCRNRTLVGSGLEGLGVSGGARTHTLTVAELASHNHNTQETGHNHTASSPPHSHDILDPQHTHMSFYETLYFEYPGAWGGVPGANYNITAGWTSTMFAPTNIRVVPAPVTVLVNPTMTGITILSNGGGAAHNNMQPYLVINYIIKT